MKRKLKVVFSLLLYLKYNLLFSYYKFRGNKLVYSIQTILFSTKISIKGSRNSIVFKKGCVIRDLKINIIGNNNLIVLGDSIKVNEGGQFLIEGNNCLISIGSKTTIGNADVFCGESETSIIIGNDSMLSTKINIDTSDFHSIIDLSNNQRINKPKNVIIGNHVWIGFNSQILKGARISDNSIIAAKALVTGKDYPSNVLLAGVPAKVIKHNINWSREKLI
jgi:acetyltransferase-like isoleucine patch superfamily enzyme